MRRYSGLYWSLAAVLLTQALAAEPQPPAIILTFDATSDAQRQVIAAIQAHVSGLSAKVVIAPIEHQRSLDRRLAAAGSLAASRQALGTFYIEIDPDGALLVFFTEADAAATLIRRLPPTQQGVRVAIEEAAIVVRSLVEALLEGGSVGIGPEAEGGNVGIGPEAGRAESGAQAEAAAETDSSPARALATAELPSSEPSDPARSETETSSESESARFRLALTAGYTGTDFAAGLPWQSGFSPGFQWLATPVFYAGARYTLFPSLTAATENASVSVGRYPLEALVGYRPAGRLAPNAELGVLAERTTRRTVSTAASFEATPPSARWVLSIAARAGFSWSPWARARASLRVGADFVLTRYAYTIDSAVAVPSPHLVRPRMELEVSVGVW